MNSNRDYYLANCPDLRVPGRRDVSILDENGDPFSPANPLDITGTVTGTFTTTPAIPGTLKTFYNEVSAVAAAVSTTVQTYTAPATGITYLQRLEVSGTNIAEYKVEINAALTDKKRTYFGGALNAEFDFADTILGLILAPSAVVTVKVIHSRPFVGDFNSRVQVIEA